MDVDEHQVGFLYNILMGGFMGYGGGESQVVNGVNVCSNVNVV